MEVNNYTTHSEQETIELGRKFAEDLIPGDLVLFYGDLGSGKTEFIKGICEYFKVDELVTSPTFTIMNQYAGEFDDYNLPIYHVDLYRIKSKEELGEIGLQDCLFSDDAIKLIEWAEKAESLLPDTKYKVNIKFDSNDENYRIIEISYQAQPE